MSLRKDSDEGQTTSIKRRNVLKKAAVGGMAISGIGISTSTASAESTEQTRVDSSEANGKVSVQVNKGCIHNIGGKPGVNIDTNCAGALNVYNNSWKWAGAVLQVDPSLGNCRSRKDIQNEILAHVLDVDDGGITLTCNWEIGT